MPTVRSVILWKREDFSQLLQPLASVIKSQYADLECLDIYIQDFFICPSWWKTLVFLSLKWKYFWLFKNPLYCVPKSHHTIEYDLSSAKAWIAGRTACRHVSQFLLVKHFTQNNFFFCVLKLHSKVVKKTPDAYINYKANSLIKTAAQICHLPHYNLRFTLS